MFTVCLTKSEVSFFMHYIMILNHSFVDKSAPDFFQKPADTDIPCGIILNMSCTVGSYHPSSMLISPMLICFDLILNCLSIRLPEYLYFKPMFSFTCKQAPDVALVLGLRFKVLPNHSQKEVMRPLYLYYRRERCWGLVGGMWLELSHATGIWFSYMLVMVGMWIDFEVTL